MSLFTIYAVSYNGSVYSGITQQSLSLSTSLDKEATDGSAYYSNIVITGSEPKVEFSTNQPWEILSAIGVAGSEISSSSSLVTYLYQYALSGARATTGHKLITCNNGIILPTKLSCGTNSNCKLDVQALLTSPTGTQPYTVSTGAVPSYTENGKYGVRSISISSSNVTSITSFDLNFGVKTIADRDVTDYCPKAQYIQEFDPGINLSGNDHTWLSSSWDGQEVSGTITLAKRSASGSFMPSTNDHTIDFHGIWTLESLYNGSGNSPASTSSMITLSKSGTTLPIVLGSSSSSSDT